MSSPELLFLFFEVFFFVVVVVVVVVVLGVVLRDVTPEIFVEILDKQSTCILSVKGSLKMDDQVRRVSAITNTCVLPFHSL